MKQQNVNPLEWFAQWYTKACATQIDKPNAMVLSTVSIRGEPSSRMVLMSYFDHKGLVFHTNYLSRKGEEIERSPNVALLFWWDTLGYQVRVEGTAEKIPTADSDSYFVQRPRGSQLGAWASEQSREIASRAELEERMENIATLLRGCEVPRPPHWGGYRVKPHAIEFWESRDNRLHERTRFERDSAGGWRVQLLAP